MRRHRSSKEASVLKGCDACHITDLPLAMALLKEALGWTAPPEEATPPKDSAPEAVPHTYADARVVRGDADATPTQST
jgi:hypothetical protein